jgi:hypothetical protein
MTTPLLSSASYCHDCGDETAGKAMGKKTATGRLQETAKWVFDYIGEANLRFIE